MDLIVVKSGVKYGVNASDVAITTMANINTLKEGSVLIAFENGTVVLASGATQGGAAIGKKGSVFYKRGGEVRKCTAIDVATAKLISPLGTGAAAANVKSFVATIAATLDELKTTGLIIVDKDIPTYDMTRLFYAEFDLDANSVKADFYNDLAAKVATHPKIASCVNGAGTLTITMDAGANLAFIASGYLEGVSATNTTALSYGQLVTAAELQKVADMVKASDGNYSSHMDGAPAMFSKDYGIEAGISYNLYAITSEPKMGYPSNSPETVKNVVYIAIPNGQKTSGTEVYLDVLNSLVGVVGDTAAD